VVSKPNAGAFQLGLVGAGRMGQTHLRALEDSSDVKVVAVAEPLDAMREKVCGASGARGYETLDDLIVAGEIDGVLVVTPSDTHVDAVGKAARAGLPILCEKPCGISADDTRVAGQIVNDAHVALQIAYWRRFVPELQVFRERIAQGDFGEILSLTCLQWDGEPPATAFRSRSGGIFVDMGVHEFDQARWLTGSDFTSLTARASKVVTDPESIGDPDSAQALGVTASGATVVVSLGRHYPGGDMASVEIFGTRDHASSVFLNPDEGEETQLEALRHQATSFVNFARGGPCQGATVEDAIEALDAAEQLRAQV
jgi:myo-inositol 2-dehydrogenase/D-chiro-inositol 1-dehydrogenase